MNLEDQAGMPATDGAGEPSNVIEFPFSPPFRPGFLNGVVELWRFGHSVSSIARMYCTTDPIVRAILKRRCSAAELRSRGI